VRRESEREIEKEYKNIKSKKEKKFLLFIFGEKFDKTSLKKLEKACCKEDIKKFI
jgi:hypothetical protein